MLIVHLGLPKTATTTLQKNVFEKLDGSSIQYLGVRQPRKREQHGLYQELLGCISTTDAFLKNCLSVKEKLLKKSEASGNPIVISEEEISVDGSEISWQQKYQFLGELLDGLEYKILVTTREPIAASYSLYVELYASLKAQWPSFSEFYLTSNNAKIYQYGFLYERLGDCFGADKLFFIAYEEMTQDDKYLEKLLTAMGLTGGIGTRLARENQKQQNKAGRYAQENNLVGSIRKSIANALGEKALPGQLDTLFRKLNRNIKNSRLTKKQVLVPFPSAQDQQALKAQLLQENLVFAKKTGIKYG